MSEREPDEKSEPSLSSAAQEVETALSKLAPSPVRMDRDRLMFLAGQAAGHGEADSLASSCRRKGAWLWPAVAGVMTAACVALAALFAFRPESAPRIVYRDRPSAPPAPPAAPVDTVQPILPAISEKADMPRPLHYRPRRLALLDMRPDRDLEPAPATAEARQESAEPRMESSPLTQRELLLELLRQSSLPIPDSQSFSPQSPERSL